MSYFNPWSNYYGQQNQWAGFGGEAQEKYHPLDGARPATQEQTEEHRRLKRRNNMLVIVLVIIVILLIAAIIVIAGILFIPDFLPTTTTTTGTTVTTTTAAATVASVNINLSVKNPNIDFGQTYSDPTTAEFTQLAVTTCDTLKAAATSHTITGCTTSAMSAPTDDPSTGIQLTMQINVLNNGMTDAELLIAVGAQLIAGVGSLVIDSSTISLAT